MFGYACAGVPSTVESMADTLPQPPPGAVRNSTARGEPGLHPQPTARLLELTGAVPEDELLDLPGGSLGQLAEHDLARRLEAREVPAAPADDFVGRYAAGIGLQEHEGARRLAPFLVGAPDHRGLHHHRVAVQAFLHL